jgi:hypothetical protein
MSKKEPVETMSCECKSIVLQKSTKAGIATFMPGYNYSKKLGK